MSKVWNFCKKYLFNIDAIVGIFIFCLVIYFIFTTKRKKYKFDLNGIANGTQDISPLPKNPKKKKRVNKHEEECRKIFEEIFGVKFKSIRPDWLKNPATGRNLELDGYNPTIITSKGKGLAFEYDGAQHSELNPHFHRHGVDEFEYQITKDSWKTKKCKERGVLLIRIPHFVAFFDLKRYIKMMLTREGIDVNNNVNNNGSSRSNYKNLNNRLSSDAYSSTSNYAFGRDENDNIAMTGGRLYG